MELTARVYGTPAELLAPLFEHVMPHLDVWLALVGGEPVSTATGVVAGDAVGVYSVGTPAEHRGHGYGSWVTARVVRGGFEAGASFAYLQSSEMGLGVYRRLGFETECTYRLFGRPRPGSSSTDLGS